MLHVACAIFLSFVACTPREVSALHIPAAKVICLVANEWWKYQLSVKYGLGIYSERDQDARLMHLFQNLGITNKYYVECGGKNSYSKSERLRREKSFAGFRLSSGASDCAPGKVVALFTKQNVPEEPDYVSIDMDFNDLWVFTNLTKSFQPRVVTIKYSSQYPVETIFESSTISSLGAVSRAALQNKYSLIGVEPSQYAYFVREDLICPGSEIPLSQFALFTGLNSPYDGMPSDRTAQGCLKDHTCPINWTLNDFPCQSHSFCAKKMAAATIAAGSAHAGTSQRSRSRDRKGERGANKRKNKSRGKKGTTNHG